MTKKKSKQSKKVQEEQPKSSTPQQEERKNLVPVTIAIGIGSHSCTVAYFNPTDQKAFVVPNPDGFYATPTTITPEDSDSGHTDTVGRAWYASADQKTGFFESVELNSVPLKETVLKFLVHIAEDYTGKVVKDVILVTPIYYSVEQIDHIERILKQNMGLNILQTVSEPLCSCVAYELDRVKVPESSEEQQTEEDDTYDKREVFLVADFGFKQSTVSLVARQVKSGLLTLLHSETSDKVNGNQVDQAILELMISEVNRKLFSNRMPREYQEIFASQTSSTVRKLKQTIDGLKVALSNRDKASVSIESLIDGRDVHLEITRAKFELVSEKVLSQATALIDSCIANAKRNKKISADFTISQLSRVILAGGTSRIIRLKQIVLKHLGISEEEAAKKCLDTVEYAATAGGAMEIQIVEEQIKENGEATSTKSKKKKQQQQKKEPEPVAQLEYEPVKVPSIPLTISLNTHGDGISTIFPRYTQVPAANEIAVSNAFDDQQYMLVRVVQGERLLASENKEIGLYVVELKDKSNLKGRGELECKLMFSVDEQGVLSVEVDESDDEVKFLLHNVKMESDNVVQITNEDEEVEEESWLSEKKLSSVNKSVQEHVDEAIAKHDQDLVACDNRDARLKLEAYVHKCRRVLRENHAQNEEKLQMINKYVSEVLNWVTANEGLTKQDYLVKLHEFHSFFTSNK